MPFGWVLGYPSLPNLSACPSRPDPHQVLRFPQKPRATLYVRVCECDNERGSKSNSLKVKHISCRLSSHLPAFVFHFTLLCIRLVNCVNVFFNMGGHLEEKEDLCDKTSKWTTVVFPAHYTGTQASQQPKGLIQFSQTAQSFAADSTCLCPHKVPTITGLCFNTLVMFRKISFLAVRNHIQLFAVTADLQTHYTHTQAMQCGNDSGITVISDGTEGTPLSPICSSHFHHYACLNQNTEQNEVFAQLLNRICALHQWSIS